MKISSYHRIFGNGPLGILISLVLLGFLWLIDRRFGPVQLSNRPEPVRIIGLILIGSWICWHSWAVNNIRKWWKSDHLCTKGPYRFVRHPMYAGGMLLADPGIALMFNSWIMLLWPLLLYPMWSLLVRREEKMMAGVFGDEYTRYAARTGRFLPRI
jgi:protein-S-isoprenylcysteine O-methyltransferase Ste14